MIKIFTLLATQPRWLPGLALALWSAGAAAAQQPTLDSLPVAAEVAAPTAAPLPRLTSLPTADQYHLVAVAIDDARPLASDRVIRLPAFSRPGQMDKVWPTLTETQRSQLQALLREPFTGDSAQAAATLRCQITDAYQLFFAQGNAETVEAQVMVELELLDAQGELLMVAEGKQRLLRRGLDARATVLNELYQQALLGAVRNGLLHLVMAAPTE